MGGGVLPSIGKMSLSLFVWHQVILAFTRYSIIDNFSWATITIYLILTLLVSIASFKFIEHIKTNSRLVKVIICCVFVATTGLAYAIYNNAGVVRDVPELGVTLDKPYANRNTEYTDQIYRLQKSFTTAKPHVLIVGNSFARDFACIIKEYDSEEKMEMSYAFNFNNLTNETLENADYMFVFGPKHGVPDSVFLKIRSTCKVYGIGTKSYGKSFGIFYANRFRPDYFNQSIDVHPSVANLNSQWKEEWGQDNFIDIMEATCNSDGKVRIFTPEHKVISFDCRHLTQDGCRFYANTLNLNNIFFN